MASSYYDVVVVGTDLAGLAYAALASRAGYRVLVLGQDGKPAVYPIGRNQGLREPPLLYGFESSPLVRGLFRDLGLYHEMRNRPEKETPVFQAVSPNTWWTYRTEDDRLKRELLREFPGEAKQISGFLQGIIQENRESDELLERLPIMPPAGFFQKRKFNKLLDEWSASGGTLDEPMKFPDNVDFYALVTGLGALMAPVRPKPVNRFSLTRLLHHAFSGFWRFPGGMDGFKQLFVGRLTARGGSYRAQATAAALHARRRNIDALVLARTQEKITFRLLVCNGSPRRFFDLIPSESRNKKISATLATKEPDYVRYCLNVLMETRRVPDALHRHLLLLGSVRKELEGTNLLWLYRHPVDDHAEPPEHTTISVFNHLPAGELPSVADDFDRLNRRILENMGQVMPFLDPERVEVSTPYLTRDRESGKPVLDPKEVREIFTETEENTLGLSAVPLRTEYKNVLMLGDAAYGALGLEGSILAARHAMDWTAENVKLKKMKG